MAPMNGLRTPPQDLDAEKALLGSIMIKPESLVDVMEIVTASDFYAEKHRRIFAVMQSLSEKSEPIDIVSVTGSLKEQKILDQIGGASYLAELTNVVPSASNLKYYAELVHKKSAL